MCYFPKMEKISIGYPRYLLPHLQEKPKNDYGILVRKVGFWGEYGHQVQQMQIGGFHQKGVHVDYVRGEK